MSSKILIADDSLTIQKVIGITLANSGYQLVECVKEEDLLKKINSEKFDLILLDFNLSDSRNGYDLSTEIRKVLPDAGLIIMLGTFDTVDESRFSDCGIHDKIVKPFESSKFIKKVRDVLESHSSFEYTPSAKPKAVAETVDTELDLDTWVVDAPKKEVTLTEEISLTTDDSLSLDPLHSEMQGWGFDSSTNLEEKYNVAFPPVIEEKDIHALERLQSSSQFVEEVEAKYDSDDTDPSFELPQDLNRNLLDEIDLEVSAEAFWAVDEVVPVKSEESDTIKNTHLDEVTADLTDTVTRFKKELELEVKPAAVQTLAVPEINMDELVQKLKVALLPHIETMVKDYCKESAEKVSWEVIPDLAENLIKKEIKNISDSIH